MVIRRKDSMECLGVAGVDSIFDEMPELGLWLKETAHGQGYGTESVKAIGRWASKTLNKRSFIYPVVVQNIPSRRIAEKLGGEIIETRSNPKYKSVLYKIRFN